MKPEVGKRPFPSAVYVFGDGVQSVAEGADEEVRNWRNGVRMKADHTSLDADDAPTTSSMSSEGILLSSR